MSVTTYSIWFEPRQWWMCCVCVCTSCFSPQGKGCCLSCVMGFGCVSVQSWAESESLPYMSEGAHRWFHWPNTDLMNDFHAFSCTPSISIALLSLYFLPYVFISNPVFLCCCFASSHFLALSQAFSVRAALSLHFLLYKAFCIFKRLTASCNELPAWWFPSSTSDRFVFYCGPRKTDEIIASFYS